MNKFRIAGAGLAIALVVAGSAACGDDSDKSASASSVAQYCKLAKDLKAAGDALPEPDNEDEAVATIATLVDEHGDLMDDYVASAPDEIHEDVVVLMAAMRAIPETHSFAKMEAASDHEAKIHEFDEKNCGIPNPFNEEEGDSE